MEDERPFRLDGAQAIRVENDGRVVAVDPLITAARRRSSRRLELVDGSAIPILVVSTPSARPAAPRSFPLAGHGAPVTDVIFVGDVPVSASWDGTVRRWDHNAHGVYVSRILARDAEPVVALAWSASRRELAMLRGDGLGRVRRGLGEGHPRRGHDLAIHHAAASPDGRWLASASTDRTVALWDATVTTKKNSKKTTSPRFLAGHEAAVTAVVFDPASRRLLSGSADGTLRVWDVATGRAIRVVDLASAINCVDVAPDGRLAAVGTRDDRIAIVGLEDGVVVGRLEGHTDDLKSVDFDATGRRLASGADDALIVLWNVADRRILRRLDTHRRSVHSVAFSPNGRQLASGSLDRTVLVFDLNADLEMTQTGDANHSTSLPLRRRPRRHDFTSSVNTVAWSLTGDALVVTTSTGRVALIEKDVIRDFTPHPLAAVAAVFDPAGRLVHSASISGQVRTDDRRSAQILRMRPDRPAVVSRMTVRADCLTTVDSYGGLRIASMRDGRLLGAASVGETTVLATPTRRFELDGGRLRVRGRQGERFDRRHAGPFAVVDVTTDDRFIVTTMPTSAGFDVVVFAADSGAERARLGLVGRLDATLVAVTRIEPLQVVVADGDRLRVVDRQDSFEIRLDPPARITALAAHPHRPTIAIGTETGALHGVDLVNPPGEAGFVVAVGAGISAVTWAMDGSGAKNDENDLDDEIVVALETGEVEVRDRRGRLRRTIVRSDNR